MDACTRCLGNIDDCSFFGHSVQCIGVNMNKWLVLILSSLGVAFVLLLFVQIDCTSLRVVTPLKVSI